MTEPLVDPGMLPLFSRPRIVPPPPATVASLQRALPTAHGQSTRPRPHLVGGGTPHVPSRESLPALDWSLVAAFRAQASEQLTQALGDERSSLDRAAQEEVGRSIIVELLDAAAAEAVSAGKRAWTMTEQRRLEEAVFNALFRMGRLQPLLDDDRVENIMITGHDRVWLELADGTLTRSEPVAESDRELVDFLAFVASRSETSPRPFSEAQPSLHLRLDDGSRLAAGAWMTSRPSVVIRRHRLRDVTLEHLVRLGTLSRVAASFLDAAVKARLSIVVAGRQESGKTTMLRALCAAIDPLEPIATFETEYELFLDEFPDQHAIVHAFEARQGSGERGADGRLAGEYAMAAQLIDSFRFNVSRQIVGEVRGAEAWVMMKAMESGTGSLSTTHADTAEATMRKLVGCAMESGTNVTHDLAQMKLAETVDLVVQMHLDTQQQPDGTSRRRRWVAEIVAVEPGEQARGWGLTDVFRRVRGGPAVAGTLPDHFRDLTEHGFDLAGFEAEARANVGRR